MNGCASEPPRLAAIEDIESGKSVDFDSDGDFIQFRLTVLGYDPTAEGSTKAPEVRRDAVAGSAFGRTFTFNVVSSRACEVNDGEVMLRMKSGQEALVRHQAAREAPGCLGSACRIPTSRCGRRMMRGPGAPAQRLQTEAQDQTTSADASYVKQHGLLLIETGGFSASAESQIYTVHPDGSGKKMLTGRGNSMPSWTPDGHIIFVSNRSGSSQIWIMNDDGSDAVQISHLTLPSVFPIAQPQMARSGLIIFSAGNSIYKMQRDGSGLRPIIEGSLLRQ
jgi:WD40-like Beta Propeller Repeat